MRVIVQWNKFLNMAFEFEIQKLVKKPCIWKMKKDIIIERV